MPVTRFAPSPTGLLHLGHAYSAWQTREWAEGSSFLVRIEDLDLERCRPHFEAWILEDLAWLGTAPSLPPVRQSERQGAYESALSALKEEGLLYPCFCSRKEIQEEAKRIGSAPHGPDGVLYPGTCMSLDGNQAADWIAEGRPHAWRLKTLEAGKRAGSLNFTDLEAGDFQVNPTLFGDPILARRDGGISYHLAVVMDDAEQGVELVTRGRDLLPACHLHRLLQALLCLEAPIWRHHRLVVDESGRRLAKHLDSLAIRTLRDEGWTPEGVLNRAFASLES
jgi:glutamyl-Q tRNA(Asp) synthetase